MKIVVLGLWHLGSVTAACCARHFNVVGLDFEPATIETLQHGRAPLFEPGLDDLLAAGLQRGSLGFTTEPSIACANSDVLWVCYDTPVDENDSSDIEYVMTRVRRTLPYLSSGALVLVSSQLPVGT